MNSAVANANGGVESARALKHARNVLLNHDLKQPVLYHLVLTGSQSIPVYQAVIKSLIRRIRSRCRLEYFGAYENDVEKGLHAHCYILIETSEKTPFKILNVNDGEYLHKLAERHELENRIHISKPKNAMHGGQFFARPTPGPLLENCLEWIEYPFKRRSKDGIPAREKYFFSEFKANKTKRTAEMQRYYAPAAPAAPTQTKGIHEERIETEPEASGINSDPFGSTADLQQRSRTAALAPDCSRGEAGSPAGAASSSASADYADEAHHSLDGSKTIRQDGSGRTVAHQQRGIEMTLTAAQRYVARLYEEAVDADLDVDEVRRYLLERGVVRTPGQVAYELEHIYCFAGYVDSHPAIPMMSVRDYDRPINCSP